VGKDRLVLESSYTFQDNPGVPPTHSFPELLVRYGVMERLELRLGWNYEAGGKGNEASGYLVTPNLEVGVRVGWGLNEQSARFFSNVGFGVRF
jgi:hypothetical protein